MTNQNSQIDLRLVREADGPEIYKWVMDPETRKNAPDPAPFSFETHLEWLKSKIQSDGTTILMGIQGNQLVGQVRFDLISESEMAISIVVSPDFRGRGIGKKLIKQGIDWIIRNNPMQVAASIELNATLRKSNLASKSVFESNGFKLKDADQDYFYYGRDLISQTPGAP